MCEQKNWNWVDKCVGGRTVERTVGLNSVRRCKIRNPKTMGVVHFFNYICPTNVENILTIYIKIIVNTYCVFVG
jgi:hypothetical protein